MDRNVELTKEVVVLFFFEIQCFHALALLLEVLLNLLLFGTKWIIKELLICQSLLSFGALSSSGALFILPIHQREKRLQDPLSLFVVLTLWIQCFHDVLSFILVDFQR